jgi:hypothetical protein
MTGVAIALLLLAAAVVWGCIVDHLRRLDDPGSRDADNVDHHRALMREIRRHAVNQQRGNTR